VAGVPCAPSSVKALRFAPTAGAAHNERAALTDASAAGVAGHEEHVCSSVLKRTGVRRLPLSGYPVALLRKWSMVVRMASCLRRGRL
jgi:hypothetical protein